MGSDPIALPSLEALYAGLCGSIDIVAIYTQPDRARGRGKKVVPNEIKQWAESKAIAVFQPEKIGKVDRLEMEALDLDAILVMAYGQMLSQKLIDTPRCSIWNLHTSLLPQYRGASPIQCAVASGDAETGVSLMRIVRKMDAGPVLDQERVSIGRLDTALDVEHRLSEACVPLLKRNFAKIFEGTTNPIEQEPDRISYVRKLGKEDGELDFSVSASVLASRVNGLFPWPSTRFYYKGDAIKVGLADFEEGSGSDIPGTVLEASPTGLRIACESGVVVFKAMQRAGGRMLGGDAFLRGFPIEEGTVLESRNLSSLVSSTHFVG